MEQNNESTTKNIGRKAKGVYRKRIYSIDRKSYNKIRRVDKAAEDTAVAVIRAVTGGKIPT